MSFVCRALCLVVGVSLVGAFGAQVMALGAKLRGLNAFSEDAAARADALWTRWWSLLGGDAGDVEGGTNRVIGGVVVLVAALVIANVVKGLYWAAVSAEARDWARSIATGPARRWSVARWTVRGGAITLVWATLHRRAGPVAIERAQSRASALTAAQ